MSSATMIEAIERARGAFLGSPSSATAFFLLEAAYDAWNESTLDECDYAREVKLVQDWLMRQAGLIA